jgi:hypothetical protein
MNGFAVSEAASSMRRVEGNEGRHRTSAPVLAAIEIAISAKAID